MVTLAFPFVMVDLTLAGVSWLLAYRYVFFFTGPSVSNLDTPFRLSLDVPDMALTEFRT